MSQLTVVIPVYDDAERLARCLDAVKIAIERAGGGTSCIVVDNGSRESLDSLISRYPGVRLIHEPKPGSYAARNTAARTVSAEVIAFTDSDCVPDENWIVEAKAKFAKDPQADLVVGGIELFQESQVFGRADPGVVAYEMSVAFRQKYYATKVHFGPTANLIVRKSVFDALNGFRTDSFSGGDKDFGRRGWQQGYKIVYAPECLVRHPARATMAEMETKVRRIVGGDHRRADGGIARTLADFLRYLVLRPANSCQLIWRNRALSASEKLAATQVAARVIGWQVSERLRIMRGNPPQR